MYLFLQEDLPDTFVYNKELKTIIVVSTLNFRSYRQTKTDCVHEVAISNELNDLIKSGRSHARNHFSPDGKYFIVCNSGIKIYELASEKKDG